MINKLVKTFVEHPRSMGLTYVQHAKRSLLLSFMFGVAGVKAFVHAIVPALFTDSSTKAAIELKELTRGKKHE